MEPAMWQAYGRVIRGLATGDRAFAGPFFVTLDLTRRCNLRCSGCRYHSAEAHVPTQADSSVRDLSVELVSRLCSELRAMDTRKICMIGEGEPFLHPRFLDLIEICKSAGFEISVVTNGTLIDAPMANRLVELAPDRIQVSLWTSNPAEFEVQCGRTGESLWSATVEGMRLLALARKARRKTAPMVVLHQPINRVNCHALEKTAQLALETGCDGIEFSCYYDHDGLLAHYAVPDEELPSVLRTLSGLRPQLEGKLAHNIDTVLFRYRHRAVWEAAPCYIGWMDARVRVDGTVVPCNGCRLVMGDLNRSSLREIWNDAPFRAFRRSTRDCPSLRRLQGTCACEFCCHLPANARTHRLGRWLTLPARVRGRTKTREIGHAAGD